MHRTDGYAGGQRAVPAIVSATAAPAAPGSRWRRPVPSDRSAWPGVVRSRFRGPGYGLPSARRQSPRRPEAAGLARHPGIGLAKSLEHIGNEVRRDPDAAVAPHDFDVRVDALEPHLHA